MHIEELKESIVEEKSLVICDEKEKLGLGFVDAKRVAVGVGARVLFYPILFYNVVRNKIQSDFRWWDWVHQYKNQQEAHKSMLNELEMNDEHPIYGFVDEYPHNYDGALALANGGNHVCNSASRGVACVFSSRKHALVYILDEDAEDEASDAEQQ